MAYLKTVNVPAAISEHPSANFQTTSRKLRDIGSAFDFRPGAPVGVEMDFGMASLATGI
jgi:hypothetical protein